MEQRGNLIDTLKSLPLAHQVVIGIAVAVLGMAAYLFYGWVSTPSMTLLYSGLEDQQLAGVVDELERLDVTYEIEGGGSRVLVPRSQVYELRAELAASGVRSGSTPQGYEILDGQGLNVSDFRQRVDYQRALEGELSRTLLAMNEVVSATVHLVIPEESLFVEDEEPVTASVLVDTARPLDELEVETITFLVASSVEGLKAADVTVADVAGNVLHAAGQISEQSAVSNRNLRMTRDYEAALADDVTALLGTVVGEGTTSVVVRAELDFDETSTETEQFSPETAVPLREQSLVEAFVGVGAPPGGTLGVDGSEVEPGEDDSYTYDRNESTTEYGVDRVVSRSITAPGKVERLSVAVVMDDGTLTGAPVPPIEEVETLIAAAIGLDAVRGDTVAVSTVAFPALEEEVAAEEEPPPAAVTDLIPQAVGAFVLLVVVVALLLMARGGSKKAKKLELADGAPAALPSGASDDEAGVGAPAAIGGSLQPEVMDLVQRQPEEVAVLLRSWLADRR